MKALLTSLLICFACCICSAQPVTDTVNNYYPVPQPKHYSPVVAGAFSYLFPGLGQIYCGESDRGLRFLGAYGGGALIFMVGIGVLIHDQYDPDYIARGIGLTGLGTMCVVYFWSIGDAVGLAISKNKATKSRYRGISFNYQPVQFNGTTFHSISCSYRF